MFHIASLACFSTYPPRRKNILKNGLRMKSKGKGRCKKYTVLDCSFLVFISVVKSSLYLGNASSFTHPNKSSFYLIYLAGDVSLRLSKLKDNWIFCLNSRTC